MDKPEINYAFKAFCTRIIDGDTIDVEIDLGFHVNITMRLRLLRVDCPERGKEGYQDALDRVKGMILVSPVTVQTVKSDSFGRYLAEVWTPDGRNVADLLLAEGLGRPYDGRSA